MLNSRQMGKSSLIVRVAQRLRAAKINVAVVELTKLGSSNTSVEKWYRSLLDVVGKALGKRAELVECWKNHPDFAPLYRWMLALQTLVKACDEPFVIAFDEIDSVRALPFSTDEFFAAIRSCFNDRVQDADLQRLSFCLIGVATPSELIRDTRMTPFNIGKRIDLQDFSLEEMQPLTQGLEREPKLAQQLLQRIAYWTNGQPYLTQKLCQAVAEDKTIVNAKGVDRVCEELFFSSRSRDSETNLQHVRTQVLAQDQDHAAILDLYRQVWRRKRLKDDDTHPIINTLRLAGLLRVLENYLWVRNRIYFRVFDEAWIIANLPDAEKQRQKAAQRRGFLQAAGIAAVMLSVVGGLAIWGWTAEQEAVKQKELAEAARELAAEQRDIAVEQKTLATQQKETALSILNQRTFDYVEELQKIPGTKSFLVKLAQHNEQALARIAQLDPDTPQAWRNQAINLSTQGDLWMVLGDIKAAQQSYQQAHSLLEQAAARAPDDMDAQRDLSISYERIGDVQLRLGQAQDALQAYQQGLEIRQRLAASDPTDAQAQRDLWVSYNKIGDVQLRLGQAQDALQAYQQGLEIAQRLAASDPTDAQAQRDLSVSYNNIGNVQLRLGHAQDALQAYQQGLEIRQRLAASDPTDAQAQRDLMVSHYKLAQIHVAEEAWAAARARYQAALRITEKLVAQSPEDARAQEDLATLQAAMAAIEGR